MKALFIPAGLLAAILAFSLWAGQYVENRTNHWIYLLEETDGAAFQEDWTAAGERLRRAYDDWDGSQKFFHTIMDHDELDEAETLFAGAMAVCGEQDGPDFHLLLAQLVKQIEILAETQSVSVKNIL